MSGLQVFQNPAFGSVRALTLDGEPWFVGKDVAAALGYKDTVNALKSHVDSEDKRGWQITTPSRGTQTATLINESGVYSLTFSSKLESAKAFKRWVTSEVLPSIRKSGAYVAGQERMTDAELMASAVLAANRMIEERDAQIRALAESSRSLRDAADYCDRVLTAPGSLTVTQIAADYGISAKRLNEILHEERIQRKVNGQWILYGEFMGNGLTESVTIPIQGKDGTQGVKMSTRWTQKGRLWIHYILNRRGIFTREQSAAMRGMLSRLLGGADGGEEAPS